MDQWIAPRQDSRIDSDPFDRCLHRCTGVTDCKVARLTSLLGRGRPRTDLVPSWCGCRCGSTRSRRGHRLVCHKALSGVVVSSKLRSQCSRTSVQYCTRISLLTVRSTPYAVCVCTAVLPRKRTDTYHGRCFEFETRPSSLNPEAI